MRYVLQKIKMVQKLVRTRTKFALARLRSHDLVPNEFGNPLLGALIIAFAKERVSLLRLG